MYIFYILFLLEIAIKNVGSGVQIGRYANLKQRYFCQKKTVNNGVGLSPLPR